jgi:type VI secretion system secreted protein VgrG
MGSFSLTSRLLSFTSPAGANVLLPERLVGTEGINELFCYKLDLLAQTSTNVAATRLVGKRVTVGISVDDTGTQRYINGIVSSFEMMNVDEEFACYRATIVPSLWMLTLNKNTRVFQNQTVVDVIQAVLSPYSISPSVQTSNTYEPLEYCTQYRETDFDFISRLMEQHGILYYFAHSTDDHTLTLQDTSSKLSDCPTQNTFRFAPELNKTEGFYDFVINEFSSRSTMVTGKFSAWDYSFVRYQTVDGTDMTTAGPLGANSNEAYDYAGATGYIKVDASDTNLKAEEDFFTTVRRDASDAGTLVVEGESNAIPMQTGYTFTLSEHGQSALNGKYLLVHVEHIVQQLPSYRSRAKVPPQPFTNKFVATPFSIVYRPPLMTQKPLVYGMHTGQVVVPQGEDSHMDKYGRVNVQFWWDRLRKANSPDNTWLRVAQSWAGKGWGTYFWPRVNDEVLIGFMEGDPDQPIVVGSVYNGVNMPKYDPAGQYTLSGILTRSSKGGGAANANELRFEDLDGKEQIFMNAEKDYDLHVEHDWHTLVGNEQHTKITSNRFDEVDGDQHLLVKGKQLEEIDGEHDLNVKGNQIVQVGGDRSHTITGNLKESIGANSNISVSSNLNEKVGSNYSLTVGQNQAISAGMNFDVSAPMQISFTCGSNTIVMSPEGIGLNGMGGFISIGPAGVTISGMMVMINSGGAPVTGSPGQAQSPQSPGNATAPTAPTFPGDAPNSQAATAQAGQTGTAPSITEGSGSGSAGSTAPASPSPSPANAAGGAAGAAAGAAGSAANQAAQTASQAANDAAQAANQAAQQAQQAATQAQQAAQQAEQQAQQAVNQVTEQARATYNQAQQAAAQAQQAANQAVGQAKAAAQQAANQAEQQAQQAAQQAAAAVQAAQQQAQQVQQQAQAAAGQAKAAAQQAQQQAQAAAAQAQQAANAAKQQGQQAAQQAQQAAQQAEQQAQQAANQAKQAAGQAQQQAQQAAGQVTQAASGAQQQAQQAAQGAQQSAQQAMSSLGGL